ncbi:flagellar biosynthetic protein FliO [Caminibacter mediatlanticus]|uniref:Transmembrane protein n=1 Tax=Caminibacter mediatlanticus TB-2 TaxID=391592 RepID=A0AAI9AIT3_9BACT|nr:flagellar biosynthetic protein FliO [Caminibacter mediatlanticus]EDM24443.1 putative transmembrane protein [Caminibacter mediatlanticus TB-2]
MKKIFFLLSSVFLFGANLINVDYFTHKNFVDVLFSLDNKFDGKVIKLNSNEFYLKNIKSSKEYIKNFENNFIKTIEVSPYKEGILVKINAQNFSTKFDLTPEGYGIRLRIKSNKILKQDSIKNLMANNIENKFDYVTYIIVLAILVILAIILWLVKKRIVKLPTTASNLNIVFQKPIDAKNKVVLIEFNKRKYLMVIGNTNILIDVFDENMVNITTNKEFDEYLKLNSKMDEIKKYIKNAEELKEFDERI